MSSEKLTEIYDLLLNRYGSQGWWPGNSRFEVVLGAILTQNTSWTNVEKAINNIKAADGLSAQKLHEMPIESLTELIRPAGYFNLKARRLKNFLDWLFEGSAAGDIEAIAQMNVYSLREDLLAIKGIGPETADSILLYAFEKEVFVVDTYTARVFSRHGLLGHGDDYEQVRDYFESSLPADVKMFNEFHALIVQVGKEYCRPKAKCQGCPLEKLPHEICPHFD